MSDNKTSPIFTEFFKNLIDYAGLFPPASLELNPALKNYADYLKSSDNLILSRFILPAAKLPEINQSHLGLFSKEHPLNISVIAHDYEKDLEQALKLEKDSAGIVSITAVETKLQIEGSAYYKSQFIKVSKSLLRFYKDKTIPVFFELAAGNNWQEEFKNLVIELSEFIHNAPNNLAFGIKIRCGGVHKSEVPPVEQLAVALTLLAKAKIPVKFTAGLHHPFRHYSNDVGTEMHGYFNLYFAAMICYLDVLPISYLVQMLSEKDNHEVHVSGSSISWLGHTLSFDQLKELREKFILSFGSCSFLEPIEDARRLKWLE